MKRMGGKGSQRIKTKTRSNKGGSKNKVISNLTSKLNAQKLPDIANINLFTEDDQVIQFSQPEVHGSFQNKTIIVQGKSVKKDIKDCFADVISEIHPEQLEKLKKSNVIPDQPEPKEEEKETEEKRENFEKVAQEN